MWLHTLQRIEGAAVLWGGGGMRQGLCVTRQPNAGQYHLPSIELLHLLQDLMLGLALFILNRVYF